MKMVPLAIMFAAVSFLTGCGANSPYTKEQAMVKDGYERVKDTLLDPESMVVYDCYAWTGKSEEQYEAERKNRPDETESELPDDLFVTYYHIGARNKMGGMTEAQYIVLYDPETGAYRSLGDKDHIDEAVDAYIDGDKSVYFDRDIQGEFLNVEFWQIMGWPERATDYEDFIKSEEFEKVDAKKILG